ncbi:DNA-binding response regulator [Yeosuana aromativorans]|uniref:DNA-binding response regulator n=1 Tax=Yeosuana aromativorans TaxID=288019 RepID=A0A8J3FFT9_9FLAO|nr:response regulator transcription factor [Yeosuana aromativorans]GGK21806.1 DNA-binding response regulator [Yeosuana aromativorans]
MEKSILLVDDHKIVRDGLKSLIEKNKTLRIISEANDGREAIKLCEKLKPDVVIMDVAMSGLNGIEATKQIINIDPNIKVIALSMHSEKQFVIGMFKAGAYGYLLKDSSSEELITAILAVTRNEKYISQKISNILIESIAEISSDDNSNQLSEREREVLQLIAEGNSSKEIGELLFLSSKTVDVHRKNIMQKLDLFTLQDLTKYAVKNGIISLDR